MTICVDRRSFAFASSISVLALTRYRKIRFEFRKPELYGKDSTYTLKTSLSARSAALHRRCAFIRGTCGVPAANPRGITPSGSVLFRRQLSRSDDSHTNASVSLAHLCLASARLYIEPPRACPTHHSLHDDRGGPSLSRLRTRRQYIAVSSA